MFIYKYWRYCSLESAEYATLDDALMAVHIHLENGRAWPQEISQNGVVIVSNDDGYPLREDSCPLNNMADEAWKRMTK